MKVVAKVFELQLGSAYCRIQKFKIQGPPEEVHKLITLHPELISFAQTNPEVKLISEVEIVEAKKKGQHNGIRKLHK